MSLVQFPDRLAANSPAPYNAMQPYLDFVAPAAQWFDTSSYGQFQLSFAAPQVSGNLGWITMNQNANLYTWDAQTHNMFAYSREAFQHAYDNWGIRADDPADQYVYAWATPSTPGCATFFLTLASGQRFSAYVRLS